MDDMYNNNTHNPYLDWIIKKVSGRYFTPDLYSGLIEILYDTDFVPIMPDDQNRWHDGIGVRQTYLWENNLYFENCENPEFIQWCNSKSCSILELMVGVCYRMDEIMGATDEDGNLSFWFSQMIQSMGLIEFTDHNIRGNIPNEILNILTNFNRREYDPFTGYGSLFYFKDGMPVNDDGIINTRDVSIWRQMNWYLSMY